MLFVLCTAAMALACSDATLPDAATVPIDASTLILSSSRVTAAIGDTVRLRLHARRGDLATDVTGDTAVHWRVENPAVAVVEGGLIVPLAAGTTDVVASVANQSVTATINAFGSVSVTQLALQEGIHAMSVGDTTDLTARLKYSSGASVALRSSVVWKSLDPGIVKVARGQLIAVAPGTGRIVVSLQGLSDTASVSVRSVPMLALTPDTVRLAPGATSPLTASAGAVSISELGALTWQSAAPAVASVSAAGVVTAATPGITTIQVSAAGAASATAVVIVSASTTPAPGGSTAEGPMPELPRVFLDTDMPAVTGRSIRVNAGDDLQAAINAAQPGDEIVVQAGATFTGYFKLPKKDGDRWITIRTSGTLPPEGTRVTASNASQMPKLMTPNAAVAVISTAPGAHHYRLVGLEVTAKPGATVAYSLITLGGSGDVQRTLEDVPSDIVLDRMYVHGTPTLSFQRCVMMNSARTAVVDSYLSECHGKGMDSQAIGGWNGPGPFKIVNNYLEAAGENILFGGADPAIAGLTPSDIEVRRNHAIKPLEWKGVWSVKNLFELKHAQRVLVEGNIFENNWVDAQTGYAILMQALSDNNSAPWTRVRDVTFRYNIIRHSPGGLNVSSRVAYGSRPVMPAEPSQRLYFHDNVFADIGVDRSLGTPARMFQFGGDLQDLRVEHNTAIGSSAVTAIMLTGDPQTGFVLAYNVMTRGAYGIFGDSKGEGKAALNYYAPGASVIGNLIAGASASVYPAGNYFPASAAAIGFVDLDGFDLRIAPGSPFAVLPGGIIPGADMTVLAQQTAGVR